MPAVLADLVDSGTVQPVRPMTALSGSRAAPEIEQRLLMLSRFDIVLLDEPTNDLDLDGLDRLESPSSATCAAASCW